MLAKMSAVFYASSVYLTHAPVVAKAFFNRSAQLKRLEEAVRVGRWTAIIGLRKLGKTSLILEIERRMSREFAFCPVDLFEFNPLSKEFFRHYALRCIDRLLSTHGGRSLASAVDDVDDYQRLLKKCLASQDLPPDVERTLTQLPSRRVSDTFVRQCLQIPEDIAVATGRTLVVAIDEFQELAKGKLEDWIPVIRSIWQRHKHVQYFISGSERTLLTDMVTDRHSPFFQHFDLMEIGPFEIQDAVELLMSNAPETRPLSHGLAEKITKAMGGHPFYLQVIGEAVTRFSAPLDDDTFKQALQETLFSRTGRLALYFEREFGRLVGRSTQLAATLSALAKQEQRLRDLAETIKVSTGAAAKYLERLGDAVEKAKEHYRVSDPVFAAWLRWRQPGGSVVPMTVLGDEAEQSVARRLAQIGFDLVYQSRASRGAFDLLATRGARQLGIQVKRSRLPSRFSVDEWNRMQAEGERLGWHWIVAVVTPPPDDRVLLLDPSRARKTKGRLLEETALITNLLSWLDQTPPL